MKKDILMETRCPRCGKQGEACQSFLKIFFKRYHLERITLAMGNVFTLVTKEERLKKLEDE